MTVGKVHWIVYYRFISLMNHALKAFFGSLIQGCIKNDKIYVAIHSWDLSLEALFSLRLIEQKDQRRFHLLY